jgi:hypothetical protein
MNTGSLSLARSGAVYLTGEVELASLLSAFSCVKVKSPTQAERVFRRTELEHPE